MKLFDAAERRGVVTLLPLLAVVVLLVTIVEIIEKPKIITHDEPTLELRDFDPNSYEYEQLREAGVPSAVAAGIVRWRSYGKVYRIKEDLTQVTGMTDSIYALLKPYIIIADSLKPQPYASQTTSSKKRENLPEKSYTKSELAKANFIPEKFLIDTVSVQYLMCWGFSQKQAEVVLHYRDASGGIRSKEQLRRCYVISDEMVERILPYVQFSPQDRPAHENAAEGVAPIRVDINRADSAQLVAIDGIGAKSAAEIIKYRELLGGYYSVEQIAELKSVTESNFEKILPKISCDSFVISKIDINFAGPKELERHPYVSAQALRRIIKQRQLKGGWSRIEEMTEQNILSEEDAKRLAPYLRFGTRTTE
jgi:competence ComEA-like helix-hairpin-helix protein